MASPTISNAFITKWNADLKRDYARTMSYFRGTVRTDGEVIGNTVRFQKLGTISMTTKSRNGEIPVQNPAHSYVDCSISDYYARTVIDKLDLTKMNIEVRGNYLQNAVEAANRKVDELIIGAMDSGATGTEGNYSGAFTRNLVLQINEQLDSNDVPRDGRRFCAVTPWQWAHLMTVSEFANADYIGNDRMPWLANGMTMRNWADLNWFVHTGLTGRGTAQVKCYAWHMDSVGHGIGEEIQSQMQWNNAMFGWDQATALAMGSTVIDTNGIVQVRVNDTVALAT